MLSATISTYARRLPAGIRARLPVWLMRPGDDVAKRAAVSGLGISGMPETLGSLPVGTPVALLLQGQPLEVLWMQLLLLEALAQGPVFVLAHDAALLDHWLQDSRLQQAYRTGALRACLMEPALAAGVQPERWATLMDELAGVGLRSGDMLLVLGTTQSHVGQSVRQFRRWAVQLGKWSRGRKRPVLLVFSLKGEAQQALGPLRGVSDVIEHLALLGSESQQSVLFLERWNTQEGPLFEARFGLRHDRSAQTLVYDGSQARGPAQRLVEAPDQYAVICTRAALSGQRSVPAAWQVLEPGVNVPEATGEAIAATVLLDAGGAAEIDALLQRVHALRVAHGRALKIVVRETQDKLRSNVEQALLHLGANAVAYRELGFARLVKLLDDLHDATFVREIISDFSSARGAFMPDRVRGYMPPLAFCNTVAGMLFRTQSRGLKHSFLRLTMQRHVAHLDAIQASTALRDGDVLTADQDALYVFMFACAETDVDAALLRLFAIAPTELFASQTSYEDAGAVRNCLLDLHAAARNGLPDYSDLLAPRTPVGSRVALTPPAMSAAPALPVLPADSAPVPASEPASEAQRLSVHARPLERRGQHPTPGDSHAD